MLVITLAYLATPLSPHSRRILMGPSDQRCSPWTSSCPGACGCLIREDFIMGCFKKKKKWVPSMFNKTSTVHSAPQYKVHPFSSRCCSFYLEYPQDLLFFQDPSCPVCTHLPPPPQKELNTRWGHLSTLCVPLLLHVLTHLFT